MKSYLYVYPHKSQQNCFANHKAIGIMKYFIEYLTFVPGSNEPSSNICFLSNVIELIQECISEKNRWMLSETRDDGDGEQLLLPVKLYPFLIPYS